jgi:hypothetical protein
MGEAHVMLEVCNPQRAWNFFQAARCFVGLTFLNAVD